MYAAWSSTLIEKVSNAYINSTILNARTWNLQTYANILAWFLYSLLLLSFHCLLNDYWFEETTLFIILKYA